ncbi:MAG: polynucleotide adenylyltransferase PcnB [Gammaproteobacteria bacterium]|nr:polynucleotide adenylyltransferase PcnB [Gammaproteobacteria bacterium]
MRKNHDKVSYLRPTPDVIPRARHNISTSNISQGALKVLYRLKNAGYAGYLVGGGVRDLLLGREPKDFDVVTDATPEQIRELFRNSRLIGRRFRLAHVRFGAEIVEVSTFRAPHHDSGDAGHVVDGRIVRDNVYGSIDEDVWRRDFTVNALFYNIADESVVDYVQGMNDIKSGCIRLIGDPRRRFIEDPVRLLRAVRFATKLGFKISPETGSRIPELASTLGDIAPARLFEECLKMFFNGYALQTFEQLRRYDLFKELFPQTEEALTAQQGGFPYTFVANALRNTDDRLAQNKPVTPGFLIAALLWLPMEKLTREHIARGMNEMDAIMLAGDIVVSRQTRAIAVPRRFTSMARDIWQLQPRLTRRSNRRPHRLIENPRFRAGYDFLLLRAQSGESVNELAEWWTQFQQDQPETKSHTRNRHNRRWRRR